MRDKYQVQGDYHWRLYHSKESNLYQKHVNKVISFFKDKKGNLLDIGCGDGLIFSELSSNKNLHCFGIDISRTAIGIAKSKGITNCAVLDLFRLAQIDKYDYIFMGDILEHLLDCEKGLMKAREHLEPDGIIFIIIPLQKRKNTSDYHLFTRESALDLVNNVFNVVSCEEEHSKIYIVGEHRNG